MTIFRSTYLQHNKAVLAKSRALHGVRDGRTSITGLEMSVLDICHFDGSSIQTYNTLKSKNPNQLPTSLISNEKTT